MVTIIIIVAVCVFLILELQYSLTHDSLGRKIKPPAKPVYKKSEQESPIRPYIPTPTGRFVFYEDYFFEKMITISKHFKLKLSYDVTDYDNECDCDLQMYEVHLTGKYNFELLLLDNRISITPIGLNVHNYYEFSYSFDFLDDISNERKAHKHIYADRGFEQTFFYSDLSFNDMSDDEIFDIIEKS